MCAVLLNLFACQDQASNEVNSTQTTTPTAQPTAGAGQPNADNPLPALAEILTQCAKVEYVLYDAGISFELQGANQVLLFGNYIENVRPDESKCPSNQYDGGVTFRKANGDMGQTMDFNMTPNCNRLVFAINGKQYRCRLNQGGINFFNEVINRKSGVIEQMQKGK